MTKAETREPRYYLAQVRGIYWLCWIEGEVVHLQRPNVELWGGYRQAAHDGYKSFPKPTGEPQAAISEVLLDLHQDAQWDDVVVSRYELGPGRYFGRIARPLVTLTDPIELHGLYKGTPDSGSPSLQAALRSGVVSASILLDRLRTVCRVVEPIQGQMNVYGHEIRHLLLLAAMEVESSLKAVLVANGLDGEGRTTNDYVRLADVMRLREWKARFRLIDQSFESCPFSDWLRDDPTDSLPWFAAYHATKHNREACLDQATLKNALDAVTASVVLLYAQFGGREVERFSAEISDVRISAVPDWTLAEAYCPPIDPTAAFVKIHCPL